MQPPHKTVIDVSGLTFETAGTTILHNVSFSVLEGEYLSILGPNGAGKTTLLKCINRILEATSGIVRIAGKPLEDYSQRQLARVLGYVPQFREGALPYRVREFLLMSRFPYMNPFSPPSRHDHRAVDKALETTHLADMAERDMATLSGGEIQKVLIAAALTQETPVLLLDEPITFLDPRYQTEINRLLRTLNTAYDVTVIAVSHDINSAVLSSDRILALKTGEVVFHGGVDEVTNADTLRLIFDTSFTFARHPVAGVPVVVPEH